MGIRSCTHTCLSSHRRQVLKVAILAEKYAVDYSWYVDTILNLIRIAGDYVSEEVWYRVLQIVTNRDDVQGYAAKTVFEVSTPSRGIRAEKGQLGLWGPPPGPSSCFPLLRAAVWSPCLSQGTGLAFTGHWEVSRCAVADPQASAAAHSLCTGKGSHSVPFTACELKPVTSLLRPQFPSVFTHTCTHMYTHAHTRHGIPGQPRPHT